MKWRKGGNSGQRKRIRKERREEEKEEGEGGAGYLEEELTLSDLHRGTAHLGTELLRGFETVRTDRLKGLGRLLTMLIVLLLESEKRRR